MGVARLHLYHERMMYFDIEPTVWNQISKTPDEKLSPVMQITMWAEWKKYIKYHLSFAQSWQLNQLYRCLFDLKPVSNLWKRRTW